MPSRGRRTLLVLALLATAPLADPPSGPHVAGGEGPVRVGILAFRPPAQTLAQWMPTLAALEEAIPERRFTLEALNYPDLTRAVAEGRLDFLFTNPEHFAILRAQYGLSAIATLIPLASGHPTSSFAGVVLAQAGRADLSTLRDLAGKTIASPNSQSLGGYAMQAWALMKAGVDVTGGQIRMHFVGMPHDRSVGELLAGEVDAAFVRSGVIEAMTAEGTLDPSLIKVLDPQRDELPLVHSTELSPEWPFTATRSVPLELVKAVSLALLNILPESSAARAGAYYGFAPPGDYSQVEALMQRLRLFPGRLEGFDWQDIQEKYRVWIDTGMVVLLILGLLVGWRMWRDRRRLRAAARRMAQLLNGLGEGVYGVDRSGRCTFANTAALTLLGYPPGEVVAIPPRLVQDPGVEGSLTTPDQDPVAATLADGRARDCEQWLSRRDGSRFPAEVKVAPLAADDDGAGTGAVVAFQDVTERRRVAEALSREHSLSDAVINAAGTVIVVLDLHGRVVRMNPAAEHLCGWTADELADRPIWEVVIPEEQRPAVERVFQELRAGRVAIAGRYENHWLARGGARRLLDWHNGVMRDEAGRVTHVVAMGNDITDRRLEQEMLMQAQKMETIGQLTGGLAHDFNNLLGIVIGNLDLLEMTPLDDHSRSLVQVASSAALRGADISRSLLAVARRQRLAVGPVEIGALVRDLLPLVRNTAGAQIQVEAILSNGTLSTRIEPSGLESAILNLVINARDAMPQGGRLLISVHGAEIASDSLVAEAPPGHYVVVEVSDNGTGMSEEVRHRATEPFFTTKERGRGTGLGLSMVRHVIGDAGGRVRIYSEEGLGTSIRLYLPALESLPKVSRPGDTEQLPRGRERVLAVDDEGDLLSLVATWLGELGYRVETAGGSEDALVRLARGGVDLLFTDIVMPGGIDGVGLAQRARAADSGLRVLLTSGFADRLVERPEGLEAPLLQKPYRRADLALAVRQALDGTTPPSPATNLETPP